MNRARSLAALVVVAVLVTGCASYRALSAYDQTSLAYVQASIAYEAVMPQLVAQRAAHRIDDAGWQKIDAAQKTIARVSPMIRTLLVVWQSTKTKPAILDVYTADLQKAVADLMGVKP